MNLPTENEPFESLCQQHEIWPTGYRSQQWQTPLFLIWYTDREAGIDRLLTNSSGNILAAESWPDLANALQAQTPLAHAEKITSWMADIKDVPLSVQDRYDLIALVASLAEKKLDMPTLESLILWRNLFGDFLYQDPQNSYLKSYHDDPVVQQVWDYYYDYSFWPRYAVQGKSVKWHRPTLAIDMNLLLEKVCAMIDAFDARINLVGPRHIAL
jgi:hypothetical protein